MKKMKKCILASLLALACAATTTVYGADSPEIVSVDATFDTTTNDKDHDTYLDVKVYNNRNVLVAEKRGIGGHWNDHSTNTAWPLT